MTKVDLHELANTPGHGKAEAALRKAGLWDDTKILDGETEFVFHVKVKGNYYPELETQYFKVTAKTAEDAKDQAEDMSDFDEIDDIEIDTVKESNE